MSGRRVVVFSSAAELGPALAHLLASRADKARGSLVSMLSKELPALPDLDCSHWLVGFCDDRLVPFDDGENTYGLHKNQLFSKINIPDSGVLAIDPSLSVQECAEDYARKLKEEDISKIVAPICDSPKPPPQCVTMTFPMVNLAHCVVFVSTGGSKAPVFSFQVLEGGEGQALPAARVVPTTASLTLQMERPGSAAKL
uniref:Glucosamine/galactosamine-6-phosphate isomerase domain-containing protein n=1 Tax=Oncorhynchus tshawytscha TaxID=74940 RepID=A0A8C8GAJ9_ONCTS